MLFDKAFPLYFLCAYGKNGFQSKIGDSYSVIDGWKAYIIKGGPGTGKSTMMRKIAVALKAEGEAVTLVHCTGDPSSLDGIILPKRKITVFDGTSPHIVEPKFVGLCESIINVGECIDGAKLQDEAEKIREIYGICSLLHSRASRYIAAGSELLDSNRKIANECTNLPKLAAFAERLALKNIPQKSKTAGGEWVRYISGVTLLGYTFLKDTLKLECDEIIAVSDEYGAVSTVMMNEISRIAMDRGYDIISCRCPLMPDKIDHIIIPDLRLGFCTETRDMEIANPIRKIHARRFSDGSAIRASRQRIAFNRRTAKELFSQATQLLLESKQYHDELERKYVASVDFEGVTLIAAKLYSSIKATF